MKIHGNFQNLEMCGIHNGAIQVSVEHQKQEHLRKKGKHQCLLESLEERDAL
jgi:hypothetical protein